MDDGPDGASHHALEDLACTRTIPNLVVMTPSDENELKAAIRECIAYDGPVYIRLARDNTPVLHAPNCDFEIGKLETLRDDGDDFAIIYEGAASAQAFDGYQRLSKEHAGKLISIRTLSPIDHIGIADLGKQVDVIITVENHNTRGGVGGAVAEVLAGMDRHAPLRHVGIRHVFTESGVLADINRKYRLTGEEVERQFWDARG